MNEKGYTVREGDYGKVYEGILHGWNRLATDVELMESLTPSAMIIELTISFSTKFKSQTKLREKSSSKTLQLLPSILPHLILLQ
jgi:hypothetical protein